MASPLSITTKTQRSSYAREQKGVFEYPLPCARQTHELIAIDSDFLVVSQQDRSGLIKVYLHPVTGQPTAVYRYEMESKYSGFHGLCASKSLKGLLWGTLQFESKVILIDPHKDDPEKPPEIKGSFKLPASVWGPHVVIEDGDFVWTTCKDSGHVVRVNTKKANDFVVYKCAGRPIFVAVHPTSKEVYVSVDLESKIMRIDPQSQKTSYIDVSDRGRTPVGLIAGPDGNVWFVLLGDGSGGTGTFGCISCEGIITYFDLPKLPYGSKVGLIHLAFDDNYKPPTGDNDFQLLRMWLLGSTMASPYSLDAIFTITMEGQRIVRQDTICLATQPCMTHRVLKHKTGLFVCELGVSILAHVVGAATGVRNQRNLWGGFPDLLPLTEAYEVPSETSDTYSLWGLGRYTESIVYVPETEDPKQRRFPEAQSQKTEDVFGVPSLSSLAIDGAKS